MDPYLDLDALDPTHPLTARKRANYARAAEAYRRGSTTVPGPPSKLTFQTTERCNLSCPHCQIPATDKRRAMAARMLDLLKAQILPDLIELHPTNLGEPFAWPHFEGLCRDMYAHGVLLDLTTNGTSLTPTRLEWIAPIARDVKVSMDGATPATFERWRRGASFSRVCDAVTALAHRLAQITVRRPLVTLQMTLMRDNVDELPELVRLAARLGAHRVKAYHVFAFTPEMNAQSLLADPEHYDRDVLPRALAMGAELGIDLQLAEPTGGHVDALAARRCFLPWHESWIDLDGTVLICHSHGGHAAGHIEDFDAAWNGPLYRSVRAGLATGAPTHNCTLCGMNYAKRSEHSSVPYDPASFLDRPATSGEVRWSGRMRQFDRARRRGNP